MPGIAAPKCGTNIRSGARVLAINVQACSSARHGVFATNLGFFVSILE
jgi:hypothetical protein